MSMDDDYYARQQRRGQQAIPLLVGIVLGCLVVAALERVCPWIHSLL
jgi:hypothetical protein